MHAFGVGHACAAVARLMKPLSVATAAVPDNGVSADLITCLRRSAERNAFQLGVLGPVKLWRYLDGQRRRTDGDKSKVEQSVDVSA